MPILSHNPQDAKLESFVKKYDSDKLVSDDGLDVDLILHGKCKSISEVLSNTILSCGSGNTIKAYNVHVEVMNSFKGTLNQGTASNFHNFIVSDLFSYANFQKFLQNPFNFVLEEYCLSNPVLSHILETSDIEKEKFISVHRLNMLGFLLSYSCDLSLQFVYDSKGRKVKMPDEENEAKYIGQEVLNLLSLSYCTISACYVLSS